MTEAWERDGLLTIGEAVAAERARVDAEIAEMAWRRAALHAVEAAAPGERAGRLAVLTAVPDGRAAHAALVRFWRRVFTAMPSRDFDDYVDMNVPPPPVDPSAEQVVAYAELTGLVADPEVYALVGQQIWRTRSGAVRDRRGLLAGLTEVCTEVVPMVVDGVPPHPGRELDRFVELHARARGERDSPGFRERLLIGATDGDRRVRRYWSLTGDLFGTPATAGGAHHWLYEALHRWSTEATPRMDRGGVASNGARGNRREITECGFPLSRGTMEVYE
ncbi:MerR family transcriptional regulator [Nocardia huaxiensis]|uniref:MerR family transcriptional regulator n=1 Tax=Nocardia huaxiensis TaxID=2755382 RepID=A0A7D6ZBC5_9NOCA|nr:MerR family transcriptional regulator [Nocardia huaxiensis]QLY29598.1 MerR family transcriptional regulator [Nocardia huaxiensis]